MVQFAMANNNMFEKTKESILPEASTYLV